MIEMIFLESRSNYKNIAGSFSVTKYRGKDEETGWSILTKRKGLSYITITIFLMTETRNYSSWVQEY